jgi:hypothetical protein
MRSRGSECGGVHGVVARMRSRGLECGGEQCTWSCCTHAQ